MLDYLQIAIPIGSDAQDLLIALLANAGFDAFEQKEKGLLAYIPARDFDQSQLESIFERFPYPEELTYTTTRIPAQNWNEQWEAAYQGVEVDDFCQVIPSFKTAQNHFQYTIRIEPKMAFGTGHHETTRSMIRMMKKLNFHQKRVLDMGCGTGILGILAAKMGAKEVVAIDIDPWSYENTQENADTNEVDIHVKVGDAQTIPGTFDLILANINRNVLLQDCQHYAHHLNQHGRLLISGILLADQDIIQKSFAQHGFAPQSETNENDWLSILFSRQPNH